MTGREGTAWQGLSPLRMLKFHRRFVGMKVLSMAPSMSVRMAATAIVSASMSPVTVITASVVTPGSVITVPVSLMIVAAIGRAIRVSVSIIRTMVVKRQDGNGQAQEETHTQTDIAGIAGLGEKTHRQPKHCRNDEDLNVFHNLTSFLPRCGLV